MLGRILQPFIFQLVILAIPLSATADVPTRCEAEVNYRTALYRIQESQAGVERAVLLRAQIQLLLAQYSCAPVAAKSGLRDEILANFVELIQLTQADSDKIAALDFRWTAITVSTVEYCEEKHKLLGAALESAKRAFEANQITRAGVLAKELAFEQHRDFCALEASIVLPNKQ